MGDIEYMKKYAGEEFLNKVYKDLVNSDIVKHTGKGSNKNEDVNIYVERLERITSDSIKKDKLSLLKKYYYDKYVVKFENIPESYFKGQEQLALERGYGHINFNDVNRYIEIQHLISEQKASLDLWIDYFASNDTSMYPTWFKYYCFQGMIRLGYYDKKEDKYTKRTESTVKPFIEINREALAMLYDELLKVLNKENVDDKKLEELLKNGSFSKTYAYCIKKLESVKKDNTNSNEGIWKKYYQGSNPSILFNDIHGKGTGWCTAGGVETAKDQLNDGDFYVYYTKDSNGEYTCPRIAIRMEHGKIAEIRGIAEKQNLESNMEKVVEEKLEEFQDKDEYKKKCKDMESLTYIYSKWIKDNNIELSKDEIKFIYEVDDTILGFGYKKDPRIDEIKNGRDIKKDLSYALDCKEEQISLNINEALKGDIIYHHGDICINSIPNGETIKLPKKIDGNLDLTGLKSLEGLILPEEITGSLYLEKLTNLTGLVLPKKIGGNLSLVGLKSAEGLIFPEKIGGCLDLDGLTSVEGLHLPREIGDSLYMSGLTTAEGLELPEVIRGSLHMYKLVSAKGLKLPKEVGKDIDLSGLQSEEGLVLPTIIGGLLDLHGLKSLESLKFPEEVGDKIDLGGVKSIKNVELPRKLGGGLDLCELTSFEGLKFPEILGGDLYLSSLTSTKGLILPKVVGGYLDLSGLTSVEELELPREVEGSVNLKNLKTIEKLIISEKINGSLLLGKLKKFNKMVIPENLDCKLWCNLTDNNLDILREMSQKKYIKKFKLGNNIVSFFTKKVSLHNEQIKTNNKHK